MAPRSKRDGLHGLEGSTPSLSACMCPWPIGRGTSLPSWQGGFDSRRALWTHASFRGRRCWYVMRDFESRGRRFDSCPRSLGDELVAAGMCHHREPMRGRLTVGRDALNVLMLVRFQPPQLSSTSETEVIRLDEELVLKTGRGSAVVGSSPTASADRRHNTRPWCNGSTAGSNPVGQGSSPWGRALGEPSR